MVAGWPNIFSASAFSRQAGFCFAGVCPLQNVESPAMKRLMNIFFVDSIYQVTNLLFYGVQIISYDGYTVILRYLPVE